MLRLNEGKSTYIKFDAIQIVCFGGSEAKHGVLWSLDEPAAVPDHHGLRTRARLPRLDEALDQVLRLDGSRWLDRRRHDSIDDCVYYLLLHFIFSSKLSFNTD